MNVIEKLKSKWVISIDSYENTYNLESSGLFHDDYLLQYYDYIKKLADSSNGFEDCRIINNMCYSYFKSGYEVHPLHLNITIMKRFGGKFQPVTKDLFSNRWFRVGNSDTNTSLRKSGLYIVRKVKEKIVESETIV